MASFVVEVLAPNNLPPLKVLNPTPTHELNYDYGFTKKRPVSHVTSKARAGAPYFRDLTDVLHSFVLTWSALSPAAARALRQLYEQTRGGAFILIDHAGGGREYVGRFSTPVEPVPVSNATFSVQLVQFDELPGIPMRKYPQDWVEDAIWMSPRDFNGNGMVTVFGTWAQELQPLSLTGVDVVNAGTDAVAAAQMQYVGYGFQLWARTGPDMGIATVSLDGVAVGTIDFYSPAATAAAIVFPYPAVPLGTHRVKLTSTNGKNAASSGTTFVWDSLRVMR